MATRKHPRQGRQITQNECACITVLGVSGQGVIKAEAKNPAIYRSKKIEEVRGVARGTAKRRMSAAACRLFERHESPVSGSKRSLDGRL
jgi:hypothetical protein